MASRYVKDFLVFPDIAVMSALFLLGLLSTITQAGDWSIWICFVIGMAAYAVSEYTTHRFVFHMKPPHNPVMLKFMKRIHYDHHTDPSNLHLLFLPLWYSLPNIAVACAIVEWITRHMADTISFATGVSAFLLYYEWKHYVAHRPLTPWSTWGKQMKRNHLWHHFKNENYWYGVTNPALDLLLGTYKDEKDVARSQTAKNLEHRPGNVET